MARMAAVKYDFKCGICSKTLDATWETDHIIPLSRARSAADFERLNSLDNLQPVHRIHCHQLKSSREAASG
jgi:5-methylcytosine-specific restriction endonuclease McrA